MKYSEMSNVKNHFQYDFSLESRILEWTENERKTREELELAKQERLKLAAAQLEEAEAKKAVSTKGCLFCHSRCDRYFVILTTLFKIRFELSVLKVLACLENFKSTGI